VRDLNEFEPSEEAVSEPLSQSETRRTHHNNFDRTGAAVFIVEPLDYVTPTLDLLNLVEGQYRSFAESFGGLPLLDYPFLGWGSREVSICLVASRGLLKHCLYPGGLSNLSWADNNLD